MSHLVEYSQCSPEGGALTIHIHSMLNHTNRTHSHWQEELVMSFSSSDSFALVRLTRVTVCRPPDSMTSSQCTGNTKTTVCARVLCKSIESGVLFCCVHINKMCLVCESSICTEYLDNLLKCAV